MGLGFRTRAVVYLALVLSLNVSANQCKDAVLAGAPEVTFGWEVEYVPGENPGLWNYYRPSHVSEAEWLAIPLAERDAWTKSHKKELAPTIRIPAQVERMTAAPAYLPQNLIVDETGNWEIIGNISDSYAELKRQLQETDTALLPGSYQAHVVMPISGITRGAAGYTFFSADLLALRKWTSQLARYRKDPKAVPGAFFLHPFLSVFSELKRMMLVGVINANMAGKSWHAVLPAMAARYPQFQEIWDENRPFYKYTLANTFRTDIYGNTEEKLVRFGFEVRGAHKSLDTLLTEVRTLEALMRRGMNAYEQFLDLRATDNERCAEFFSAPVVTMLKDVIPESEIEAPRWQYFAFIYRPLEQYVTRLNLTPTGQVALRRSILTARTTAIERLEKLSAEYAAGTVDKTAAKDRALLILAEYAEGTGLLERLETYLQDSLGGVSLAEKTGT